MKDQAKETSVRRQLLALMQMDKEELVTKWQDLFGTTPPEYGVLFMRRRLAHRIQELFYGGLPEMLKTQMLEQKKLQKRNTGILKPGNRIIRTWHGVAHEVIIRNNGVEYQGVIYRSLTAVAKKITGAHWNGKTFFGVK
jgi:hypothetical protein